VAISAKPTIYGQFKAAQIVSLSLDLPKLESHSLKMFPTKFGKNQFIEFWE